MPNAGATRKQWALYVYMCGDVPEPGMHTAAKNNLHQMLRAGSSEDMWVVAQISEPDRWTYRYSFPPRTPGVGVTVEPQVMPTENSASPQAILEFVAWASERYPADQIMLVLWGHGFGLGYFVPYEFDSRNGVHELPLLTKTALSRRMDDSASITAPAAISPTQGVVTEPQPMGSFGVDDHARSVLNNHQIGDVLRSIVTTLPKEQRLSIVGLDACAMSMAEVYSEFEKTGTLLGIASEAGLPYLSWPYDTFLKRWQAAPAPGREDVAAMLKTSFEELYAAHPRQYVTLSICSVELAEPLLDALRLLVGRLIALTADEHARLAIFTARNYSPEYDEQGFIDLGCFVSNLQITLPDPELFQRCKAVLEALGRFVVDKTYSPKATHPGKEKKIAQSTGISVWFPQWIQYADAFAIEKNLGETYLTVGYHGTAFAVATGWDKMLSYLREWAWGLEDTNSKRTGLSAIERAANDLNAMQS